MLTLVVVIGELKTNAAHSRRSCGANAPVLAWLTRAPCARRRLVRLTPHAWCLDVAFNEDNSRIPGYAPENMTLIRHIALNLLAQETSLKVGKKAKRLQAGWDDAYLAKVLAV